MYRKIIEFRVKITLVDALEFSVCGIGNCALQFKTKAALLEHLHVDHDMKTMESYEPIKCFHCTVPFGDVEDYANHIALHGYNRFVCMLCLCYHFLLSYVVDHMRESHGCTMTQAEMRYHIADTIAFGKELDSSTDTETDEPVQAKGKQKRKKKRLQTAHPTLSNRFSSG